MRPLMKDARAVEASLVAAGSLAMVRFLNRSSRTFRDWAFSLADILTFGLDFCFRCRVSSLGRNGLFGRVARSFVYPNAFVRGLEKQDLVSCIKPKGMMMDDGKARRLADGGESESTLRWLNRLFVFVYWSKKSQTDKSEKFGKEID